MTTASVFVKQAKQHEGDDAVVPTNMDALEWLRKHLEEDGSDVLREMVRSFAEALMSAEADAACGAGYGERSLGRVTKRNGYRSRDFDTRAGTIELAIPKLRRGSYFPEWLLQPRRRAEQALTQVICQCYVEGVSTRVDGLTMKVPEGWPHRQRRRRDRHGGERRRQP